MRRNGCQSEQTVFFHIVKLFIFYSFFRIRRFCILLLIICPFPASADNKQEVPEEHLQEEEARPFRIKKEQVAIRGIDDENTEEGIEEKYRDKTKGLYLLIGHYAYFPELNSEKPVYIVDEIGRGMVPGWQDIVTFKDMRKIGLFGDIWAGVGLHCGEFFSFWSVVGGGLWKINNRNRYGPLKFQLDLKGVEFLAGVGWDYYPFGKTKFSPVGKESFGKKLKQVLSETKPYFSLFINYSHFEASGNAKVGFLGSPIKYSRKKEIDIISITPFVGFDVPVTRRTDIFMGLGYLFGFDTESFEREHKNEIEGPVAATGVKIYF